MNFSILQETAQRGTSDFPIEYHKINKNHPRYQMQMHWHKDIEIIRITKGIFDAQIGDESYSLKAGHSIYIPGGVAHGATSDDCEYECIVFSPAIMYSTQRVRTLIKSKILYPVTFFENEDVKRIFDSINAQDTGFEFEIMGLLYKITNQALNAQLSSNTAITYRSDKIKPAIYYIQNNYQNNISLMTLAEECMMSANYFSKIFKDVTGQTPIEYITTYRLEAACEMLLSGAKVTDAAFDCGFNDLSYFIHVFKKNIGISPKQYSKEQIK